MLVSCVLLVSYYIKAMFWSGKVADCVVDPTGCMHATIGRFFRSADDLTEKWVQRRLYNALETLIEQKPRVDGLFDTAEGLTAQLSSAADGLFAGNILARSATGQLALNTTDILQDLVRGMDNTVEGVFKVLGQTMVLVRNSVTIEGEVREKGAGGRAGREATSGTGNGNGAALWGFPAVSALPPFALAVAALPLAAA